MLTDTGLITSEVFRLFQNYVFNIFYKLKCIEFGFLLLKKKKKTFPAFDLESE